MKAFYLMIVLVLVIVGCDKRKDFYLMDNQSAHAAVTLNNSNSAVTATWENDSTVRDTLKMGHYYRFTMNLEDENDLLEFDFDGDGVLYKNGIDFSSVNEIKTGVHQFEWYATYPGLHELKLSFTDSYGKVKTYSFNIEVFVNRVPSISWVVDDVGNISPYEKKINVSGVDGDALYGGEIVYYEYVINSDTTIHPVNYLNYAFPSPGNYFISVRARDDNDEWSNAVIVENYVIN